MASKSNTWSDDIMQKKTGKIRRTLGAVIPIFKKESVSEFAEEMLREDETLRIRIQQNPQYRQILERKIAETFQDYRGVLTGAKVIDTWDRVTSAPGMAADAAGLFTGGLSNLLSVGEEVIELIPKGIYAIYYRSKTGDKKAVRYWAAREAASFIPFAGDAIDMTNIYVNRARKMTKQKVRKEMEKITSLRSSELESKVR